MKPFLALLVLAIAAPASAELIVFSSARSMSVASHRTEGDRLIVKLRGGGEMTFDRALVAAIVPDEVPYPEEPSTASVEAAPEVIAGQGLAASTSYDAIIERASEKHDVDPRLVKAVIQVESNSNIDAGTKYLSKLLSEFELPLALAAYNAGEGAVRRFGGIPPYAETRAYVAKILGLLGKI
jgi:soluble lytic murein transglycosylase-like protein